MAREGKQARHEKRFGKPRRVADAIAEVEWRMPPWLVGASLARDETKDLIKLREDLIKDANESVRVDISNIIEFFYAVNSKEEWNYKEDFPCCTPPMKTMFFEGAAPSCINSEGKILPAFHPDMQRFGWVVDCTSRDEILKGANGRERLAGLTNMFEGLVSRVDMVGLARRAVEAKDAGRSEEFMEGLSAAEKTIMSIGMQISLIKEGRAAESVPPDLAWVANGYMVWLIRDEIMPIGSFALNLDREGRLIDTTPLFGLLGGQHIKDVDRAQNLGETMRTTIFPLMLAMSFMNCKNTVVEPHEPDHKLNRERTRHGLKPFLRYHTINIEPMRKVLRTEGGIEANGLKKALHICRGHFARYSEDKPLFGHTSGLVWRPAHTRGSVSQGVVVSDYKVNALKAEPAASGGAV